MTRDSIRQGLVELALRVEAAAGPTKDLFIEVWHTSFPKPGKIWADEDRSQWTGEYESWHVRQVAFYEFVYAEAWLDAAMSLVPEGWAICTGHGVEGEQGSYFTMLTYLDPETESETVREATGDNWAATICAAALRAKAQS